MEEGCSVEVFERSEDDSGYLTGGNCFCFEIKNFAFDSVGDGIGGVGRISLGFEGHDDRSIQPNSAIGRGGVGCLHFEPA